jgi:predicted unusual protein kinase regulating ubiquinone biosynthesis (AarF/ABC1/UbiB family)
MILSNIYILSKWIYFICKICIYFKWITTTSDGGIYLKNQLTNLGILGIKLGQYLYTQRYILENKSRDQLESLLYDNKVHLPIETIEMISLDNINMYNVLIDRINFNNVLGSGSLAQSHICYLKNDTNKYVIKVAHPEVLTLPYEIKIVKNIIKVVSYFKKVNINWDEFFSNILDQCDMNIEGKNMMEFKKIYKNYDKIEIPQLIYCNTFCIIMTFCEGIPMNKLDRKSKKYLLATNLVAASFLHTSYMHNIVHGDLHQGNVLVKDSGNIALIDYGICKKTNNTSVNDILYVYENFVYNAEYEILEKITTLDSEQKKISFELGKRFVIDYNLNMPPITDPDTRNMYFLPSLREYCFRNNIILDSEFIYYIMNLILLESYTKSEVYNGNILLRTLSYMKTDNFFMEEMREYILKFYKLEYENEYKSLIKIRYP